MLRATYSYLWIWSSKIETMPRNEARGLANGLVYRWIKGRGSCPIAY
jgi:hypothetical protein